MRVQQSYSQSFKEAIVTKILNRGSETVAEVCAREGVILATAQNWVRKEKSLVMKQPSGKRKKWSAEAKLKAVSETMGISEAEVGQYLRREGIHSGELEDWRLQIVTSLSAKSKAGLVSDERDEKIKDLEGRLSVSERELLRKDKALADVSALLILQKKVRLLLEKEDLK